MPNDKKPVGSGIVHPTRPNIHQLIGADVIVTHHDEERHGTWDGELEGRYLNDSGKGEDFIYVVQGQPCDYCGQRCTDGEGQGCDEWNSIPEAERFQHSSQPTLQFKPHAVFSLAGNVITLG